MKTEVLKFVFVVIFGAVNVNSLLYPWRHRNTVSQTRYYTTTDDVGEPLILTSYIEANKSDEAKNKSRVIHKAFLNVTSYSGYFTVDKAFESNLFFWLFPAEENYDNAPVMLWLQGGPGDSSFTGLFAENGPLKIINDSAVELRNERWTKHISMLYIDNPVGTGYSFTRDGGHCENQTIVGEHLHKALEQFFKVFPELVQNDFFVAGESYGGKYGPSVAYTIHKKNSNSTAKINLKGVALDSGYSDPEHMLNYADYLYQTGLLDQNAKREVELLQNETRQNINKSDWEEAFNSLATLLATFSNKSGIQSMYNYLHADDPVQKLIDSYTEFVQIPDIRKAIHVGNLTYDKTNDVVYEKLIADFLKTVAPWIKELLNNYRLMTYNGQFDIIVAYPLTENYLQNLNFSSAIEYKTAERKIWRVDKEIAGYVKTAGNLTEVLVRNGGHVLVHDQPKFCYDLINKFVKNVPIS